MTLSELQSLATTINQQVKDLRNATTILEGFMASVITFVNDPNFSSTIDVDAFVAIQLPIFTSLLTAVEQKADALNSDILN